MSEVKSISVALRISLIAVFTAIITVATVTFSVSVPATKGYFNIGETAIYISALLFGASIGGISAGIGSMIADLLLGYTLFAPATLLIKGIEGTIVGFLGKKDAHGIPNSPLSKAISIVASLILGIIILTIGSIYYTGSVEFNLASPSPLGFKFNVPLSFWIILSLIVTISTLYISLSRDPGLGSQIVAVLIGGMAMVTGYFLYEQLILGAAAIVEVPINIGQMMIGALVAIPLVRAIKTRIPQALKIA